MKILATTLLMLGTLAANASCLDKIKDYVSDKEDQIAKMPFYTKTSEFGIPVALTSGTYAAASLGISISGPGPVILYSSSAGGFMAAAAVQEYLYNDIDDLKTYMSYAVDVIELLEEAQAYDGPKLRSMLVKLNGFGQVNRYTMTTLADAINEINEKEGMVCTEDKLTTTHGIYTKLVKSADQQED